MYDDNDIDVADEQTSLCVRRDMSDVAMISIKNVLKERGNCIKHGLKVLFVCVCVCGTSDI